MQSDSVSGARFSSHIKSNAVYPVVSLHSTSPLSPHTLPCLLFLPDRKIQSSSDSLLLQLQCKGLILHDLLIVLKCSFTATEAFCSVNWASNGMLLLSVAFTAVIKRGICVVYSCIYFFCSSLYLCAVVFVGHHGRSVCWSQSYHIETTNPLHLPYCTYSSILTPVVGLPGWQSMVWGGACSRTDTLMG